MGDIHSEIEQAWKETYAKGRRNPEQRTFMATVTEFEAAARAETAGGFYPWLGILEFGLEWLTHLYVALGRDDEPGPLRPELRAPWALIGAAVPFGLSIRTLCLSGFDTPARALLRSLIEALLLCVAVLDDPKLAEAFTAAEDDAAIKHFWHTLASPRNLHRRIMAIEAKRGVDGAVTTVFAEFRKREYEVLSQASHLSFVAATMTAFTSTLGNGDELAPAFLGKASSASNRTISYASLTIWYFSVFAFESLLKQMGRRVPTPIESMDDVHFALAAGHLVLSKIVLSHYARIDLAKGQ